MSLHSRRPRTALLALAAGWCYVVGGQCAEAAPPHGRLISLPARETDARGVGSPGGLAVPHSRLDLAPPALATQVFERPAATVFPAAQRRMAGTDSAAGLPTLGSGPPVRIMSRPEILARNFKREGLPLARLFQSENSLVHVGLNPKGKPGLWFVEKLH